MKKRYKNMKRVGLRNKIISRYWNGMCASDIKKQLGCTQQTINKWLKPIENISDIELPKKLISLGWSAGEIIRVLKIDEDELDNIYGVKFMSRGIKLVSDEELIEYIDSDYSIEDIVRLTDKSESYIRRRLNELGWVK